MLSLRYIISCVLDVPECHWAVLSSLIKTEVPVTELVCSDGFKAVYHLMLFQKPGSLVLHSLHSHVCWGGLVDHAGYQ